MVYNPCTLLFIKELILMIMGILKMVMLKILKMMMRINLYH